MDLDKEQLEKHKNRVIKIQGGLFEPATTNENLRRIFMELVQYLEENQITPAYRFLLKIVDKKLGL